MKKKTLKKPKDKYAPFLKWCLNECWEIQQRLNLTSYRIHLQKLPTKAKDEDEWAFRIQCGFPYQFATIEWPIGTYEEWKVNKDKTRRYLLHEMLHIILEPIASIGTKRWATEENMQEMVEMVTDQLTSILNYAIQTKN